MLTLAGLTKRYGTLTALTEVSLHVRAGEFFGLLGPNGAGKSTLMALISGLRPPDSGRIDWNGGGSDLRSHLGLVPQRIALYPRLSAEQNLQIFGRLHGLRGRLLRERVEEALVLVQLQDRRRHLVETFSGGMRRRLNLVAALLHRPALLLCDEPTVGVDPQSRNAIFEVLEKLNRDGMTVIYSTHYMEEATRLCSRIGIIDHGRLLAVGTLEELLTQLPFEEEIRFPSHAAIPALLEPLSARGEITSEDHVCRFRPRPDCRLSTFFSLVEQAGLPERLFVVQRPSLEALFLHLTGRSLRE